MAGAVMLSLPVLVVAVLLAGWMGDRLARVAWERPLAGLVLMAVALALLPVLTLVIVHTAGW